MNCASGQLRRPSLGTSPAGPPMTRFCRLRGPRRSTGRRSRSCPRFPAARPEAPARPATAARQLRGRRRAMPDCRGRLAGPVRSNCRVPKAPLARRPAGLYAPQRKRSDGRQSRPARAGAARRDADRDGGAAGGGAGVGGISRAVVARSLKVTTKDGFLGFAARSQLAGEAGTPELGTGTGTCPRRSPRGLNLRPAQSAPAPAPPERRKRGDWRRLPWGRRHSEGLRPARRIPGRARPRNG